MDNLIDINNDQNSDSFAVSGDTSVFRFRELAQDVVLKICMRGMVVASLIAVALGPMIFIIIYFLAVDPGAVSSNAFVFMIVVWLLFAETIGWSVPLWRLNIEKKNGFLKIDDDNVEYWTGKGPVRLDVSAIFGAGPVKGFFNRFTRFYYLSGDPRGFAYSDKSFKYYVPVSGPAYKTVMPEADGDDLVREAMILHIKRRQDRELRTAELPRYAFDAVQTHKQMLLVGDVIVDAIFECDGKTIRYVKKEEEIKIPVRSVTDVKVVERRSEYGRTAYFMDLTVEQSVSLDKIRIDILGMPKPEEIDKYCRALPSLFPESASGYWD